jgi:ribonuclease T2
MKQIAYGIILVGLAAGIGAWHLSAQPQNEQARPGVERTNAPVPRGTGFDFYVLALSWSPTYCQDDQARRRDVTQCAGPRPFAFVVHGLWPQFERGYPRACQTRQNRPSQNLTRAMLDIMPSERLVQHQWNQHGTCSGLDARDYFALVRAAHDRVTVPDNYKSAPDWRQVNAGEVERAFIAANPLMKADGIAVTRRGNRLSEVRLCLTLDLKPRACREVDQDGAPANTRLAMPPSRG